MASPSLVTRLILGALVVAAIGAALLQKRPETDDRGTNPLAEVSTIPDDRIIAEVDRLEATYMQDAKQFELFYQKNSPVELIALDRLASAKLRRESVATLPKVRRGTQQYFSDQVVILRTIGRLYADPSVKGGGPQTAKDFADLAAMTEGLGKLIIEVIDVGATILKNAEVAKPTYDAKTGNLYFADPKRFRRQQELGGKINAHSRKISELRQQMVDQWMTLRKRIDPD